MYSLDPNVRLLQEAFDSLSTREGGLKPLLDLYSRIGNEVARAEKEIPELDFAPKLQERCRNSIKELNELGKRVQEQIDLLKRKPS